MVSRLAIFAALLFITASASAQQVSEAIHQWSILADLHGRGTQAGIAIGGETPVFLDALSIRVGFSYDQLKNSATDTSDDLSVDLGYAQLGIKALGNRESTIGLFNSLVLNFNFYLPRDGTTRGSRFGSELCYELEWRQRYQDGWTNSLRNFAAFIEMGLADSQLRAASSYGGEQIGNGFISRLGFRRFF